MRYGNDSRLAAVYTIVLEEDRGSSIFHAERILNDESWHLLALVEIVSLLL